MKTKDYIEAELEFDPEDIGCHKDSDYEIRVYAATPSKKKNVCMKVIIAKKGVFNATEKRQKQKNDLSKH